MTIGGPKKDSIVLCMLGASLLPGPYLCPLHRLQLFQHSYWDHD